MENNNGMEMVIDATVDENGQVVENVGVTIAQKSDVQPITVRSFSSLPEVRQKAVLDFVPKINLQEDSVIMNYGDKVLEEISKKSSEFIQNAKGTKEEEEVKKQLAMSLDEAIKIKDKKEGFFSALFKRASDKYDDMKERYISLDKILEGMQQTLGKQITIMNGNLNDTESYISASEEAIRHFEDYLVAGQLALDNAKNNLLPALSSGDSSLYNSEKRKLEQNLSLYEKKLANLEMSRACTIGLAADAMITRETSKNNIIVLKDNYSHTLTVLRQVCALALMHERNKISHKVSESLTAGTEKMITNLTKDIKSEALEIAKKSREGFMDPACIEGLVKDIKDCTSEMLDIYENSTTTLNAGLERIRNAEEEFKKILSDKNATTSTSAGTGYSSVNSGLTI